MSEIILIKKNLGIENYFNLTYNVTECCNYHCPYCMQGNKPKKDTNSILIEKISKEINKIICKLKQQGKNIDFHLIGGEVSIYDIKNLILKNIDLSNIYRFSMVTNLSRSVEYYKELLNYLKENKVNIRIKASFHPTEVSEENFINKIKSLKDYNIIPSLLLTKNEEINECVYNVYNKLKEINIQPSVSVERVNGIPIDISFIKNKEIVSEDRCKFHVYYSNNEKELLTKYELLNKIKDTKEYLCDINSSKLIIGSKGNIKNACSQQKNNGTIFNFKLNNQIIKCNANHPCTLYAINELKKYEIPRSN